MAVTALGQVVVPYSQHRVSLILPSLAGSLLTYSLSPTVGVDLGMTVRAAGAPLELSLGRDGAIVFGPLYLVDGTVPLSATYLESLNHAP